MEDMTSGAWRVAPGGLWPHGNERLGHSNGPAMIATHMDRSSAPVVRFRAPLVTHAFRLFSVDLRVSV